MTPKLGSLWPACLGYPPVPPPFIHHQTGNTALPCCEAVESRLGMCRRTKSSPTLISMGNCKMFLFPRTVRYLLHPVCARTRIVLQPFTFEFGMRTPDSFCER